ncbi:MAG TPA: DUF4129 domain-containing protein [Cyclobacteriaceae bacterium]|nr:DUF4129 domain-containing protein [Cyclobacteriaceae bacterium]
MKHLTALLFGLIVSTALFAQDEAVTETDTTAVEESESDASYNEVDPKDSESVAGYIKEDHSARKFDKDEWKSIVGDETFQEKARPEPKPWKPWFKMPGISPGVIQLIAYTLVFIGVGFLLYYVLRNASFSLNPRIKKAKITDITVPVENIEEVDIEGLLKQALANGDFRLAVRVHYLLLLKKLNQAEFIIWKKDKTNRDYLSELYGRDTVYDDVRKLTLAYELVWYGERGVSHDSFQRISGEFESVNRQVVKENTKA